MTQATRNYIMFQSRQFAPFSDCFCLIECGNIAINTAVALLSLARFPMAVFRGIATLVISALYRSSFWAFPHVGVEILERFKPALTNRNTATSVVRKSLAARVVATLFHSKPALISWTMRLAVSLVVEVYASVASATSTRPKTQTVASRRACISTITQAKPVSSVFRVNNVNGDYQKFTEPLTDMIKTGSVLIGHRFSPLESVSRGFGVFSHLAASFA